MPLSFLSKAPAANLSEGLAAPLVSFTHFFSICASILVLWFQKWPTMYAWSASLWSNGPNMNHKSREDPWLTDTRLPGSNNALLQDVGGQGVSRQFPDRLAFAHDVASAWGEEWETQTVLVAVHNQLTGVSSSRYYTEVHEGHPASLKLPQTKSCRKVTRYDIIEKALGVKFVSDQRCMQPKLPFFIVDVELIFVTKQRRQKLLFHSMAGCCSGASFLQGTIPLAKPFEAL